MKKRIAALLLAAVLLAGLGGCAGGNGASDGKLSVVCTIFPQYDFVRQILGRRAEEVELTLLLDGGVDMHSYQPTAADLVTISGCDLFIYVGGESDAWATDILRGTGSGVRAISLMELVGEDVREEELTEGMQAEDEHDHDKSEPEYDEHVWLSLHNAGLIRQAIADALCELDPGGAELYTQNCKDYNLNELYELDQRYQELAESAKRDALVFADRFPFRYLAEDYGLNCYAAFPGCSAETEASFATIAFLADKVDELALPAILVIDGSDSSIAETVAVNTAAGELPILVLDSMQTVTAEELEAGVTYLSIMEKNLEVLKQALN